MMRKSEQKLLIGIVLCMLSVMGCGKDSTLTAPSKSVITLNPATTSLSSLPTPALVPYKALVTDGNGKPMNGAKVYITGTFAVPFGAPVVYYQFYKDKEGLSFPVDSGFEGITDDNGVYEFSVRVSGLPFDEQNGITVSSGTAIVTASLTVT